MKLNEKGKNIPKPTNFGKNLKFLRRMRKLTQDEMGTIMNCNRNNIASYEGGIVEPSASRFLLACDYFGISPSEILNNVYTDENLPYFEADLKESVTSRLVVITKVKDKIAVLIMLFV